MFKNAMDVDFRTHTDAVPPLILAMATTLAIWVPFLGIYQLYLQPGWVDPGLYLGAFLNMPQNIKEYGPSYQSMRLPFTLIGYFLHHTLSHEMATYVRVFLFNAIALVSVAAIIAPRCGRLAAIVTVLWLGVNPLWVAALTRGYVDGAAMAYSFATLAFLFNSPTARWPLLFVFLAGFCAALTLFTHPAACIALGFVVVAQYVLTRKSIFFRLIEFVCGIFGAVIAVALLSYGSRSLGGIYAFFLPSVPEMSEAFSGRGAVFQYPLADWLPNAFRLVAACGLSLVAILIVSSRWDSAGIVLKSGTFGLMAFGAFMLVQDIIIGGAFLQSSYYAGYVLISQVLLVGSLAGIGFRAFRKQPLWVFAAIAAVACVSLLCFAYIDLLWHVVARIDRSGIVWWVAILLGFAVAASLFLKKYKRSAVALICFLTLFCAAINDDTRNIFKTPAADFKPTFRTAIKSFDAIQRINQSGRITVFMFNRDDLTALDAHRSTTTYKFAYGETNFVMNLWDTIASFWGWDLAIVGGYVPEIKEVQLRFLRQLKNRPTTIVSFCVDEGKCDLIRDTLAKVGIVLAERGRTEISGQGYIPFSLRVSDMRVADAQ